MKKIQVILGLVLAIATLIYGLVALDANLLFRLFIGLTFGYALVRGSLGFAGSVNRTCRTGSTKLVRSLMLLFVISSIGVAVLIHSGALVPTPKNFWVNPINLGLMVGAVLFGIGMAFASCCATGVLTDLSSSTIKALIVIVFFGIGVFLGFPIQKGGYAWVSKSLITTETFADKGFYFPDLFNGPFNGLLGGILIVIVLALIVTYTAIFIEKLMKKHGKFNAIADEEAYKTNVNEELPLNPISKKSYEYILGNPWSQKTGVFVIAGTFLALFLITGKGWGASTIYGLWVGKVLTLFGVSAESIAEFTKFGVDKASSFTGVFESVGSVQNLSIAVGALIAVLTMSRFKFNFKISWRELIIFVVGGLLLGFGTRLANGCNVGALYTPIASFSLSGWIFLVFMVFGGILGNVIMKIVLKK